MVDMADLSKIDGVVYDLQPDKFILHRYRVTAKVATNPLLL